MAKDWIRPIELYRTPEQHRMLVQTPESSLAPKPRKAKKHKRGRWKQIPGFETYADYLKSDEWKAIKSRWMKSKLCKGDKCSSAMSAMKRSTDWRNLACLCTTRQRRL